MTEHACRYSPWGREPLPTPASASAPGIAIRLPEAVYSILLLAAAHDGVSPAKLIDRLVCDRAEAIGLSVLADENERLLTQRHDNSRLKTCRGGDHG
ncbi:MAG: hypothetical protein MEQ84_07725 [Mesorhizobium sp.]|nr:hypothetical protein [Mesorhizobium sp.]